MKFKVSTILLLYVVVIFFCLSCKNNIRNENIGYKQEEDNKNFEKKDKDTLITSLIENDGYSIAKITIKKMGKKLLDLIHFMAHILRSILK